MDAKPLLDPKNDFVFKRLFADAPDLLTALINAVRSSNPPVRVVQVLNPRIDPTELLGKYIVLDVLAEDEHGRRYNVEMQVRRHLAWSERSLYYLARTFVQPMRGGDGYQTLKPAIGIHLLDFELFPDPKQALWCFEMRDRVQPAVTLGEELQLNLIELPKADRAGVGGKALAAWVAFLEHWQEEERMAEIDYPPVQQALKRIRRLSADEEAQHYAMMRERAVHTEVTELRGARAEGLAEGRAQGWAEGLQKGLEQGLEQGREQGLGQGLERGLRQGLAAGRGEGMQEGERNILLRLLERRFGPLGEPQLEQIRSATSAEIEVWAERLLEAASIAEVLG